MNEEHIHEATRMINENLRGEGVTFEDLLTAASKAATASLDDYPWAVDLVRRAEHQGIPPEVTAMAVKTALTTSIAAPSVASALTTDKAADWTDEDPLLAASKAMTFAMGGVIQGAAQATEQQPMLGPLLKAALPMLVTPGLSVAAMLAQQSHDRKTGG